ncbi:hypothetical protein M5K25_016765 [Dendrobium thyrsiflorum]|uniref:Uncharacterized protein n=1 Tax=Dendrobium thyrsiflorum TaxID=117978 RepID=A0ABD0UL05_DENTH
MAAAGHGVTVVGEWQNFGDERPFLDYLSSTWFMQRDRMLSVFKNQILESSAICLSFLLLVPLLIFRCVTFLLSFGGFSSALCLILATIVSFLGAADGIEVDVI